MARPTEEGTTSAARTTERQRRANQRASRESYNRFQSLSTWTPENTSAARELATPRFGGVNTGRTEQPYLPPTSNSWGVTADTIQYGTTTSQRDSVPGLREPVLNPEIAEKRAAAEAERKREVMVTANRAGRKQAIADPGPRPETDRMTWAEYNKLTPEQRAAVDFNTMLVRAVRTDLKNTDDYAKTASADDKQVYDATLEKMFGSPDRGSEIYAPETLGLLKQIGYSDRSADLDDFLKLKAAITEEDLADLPTVAGVPEAVAYSGQSAARTEELSLKRGLASSTAEMESTLAKGNTMLQSIQAVAAEDRGFIIEKLGGLEDQGVAAALGYQTTKYDESGAPADLNTFFIEGFDKLANKANAKDQKEILGAIKAPLSDSEYNAFLNYANSRSNNAARFELPLGEARGVKYRSPEDFRELLGLKGGTPGGPTY